MDTEIVLVISAAIFVIILLSFLFRFMMLYQKRTIEFTMEKEAIESKFQRELLRAKLEIQEQTFKTISQEIHDNIGQMLSLAKLNLNRVNTGRLQNDMEKVQDAKELISKSIQDLRDLSRSLNTETIAAIGLMKAIELELQMLQKTGTVQTRFEISGTPIRLDPQKELILFRISQEALHNIIKHATATFVGVSVSFHADRFELVITDNGVGFDSSMESNFGSGLHNMKSRSELIGAAWQVTSAPETGTTILIYLPIID